MMRILSRRRRMQMSKVKYAYSLERESEALPLCLLCRGTEEDEDIIGRHRQRRSPLVLAMSRQLRFTALRRSVLQGVSDVRRQNCGHHLRYLLLIGSIILILLLALVILSLAIFIYLVPCPVWLAGNGGGRLVIIGNSSSRGNFNGSTTLAYDGSDADERLTTPSSSTSDFSFLSSSYRWRSLRQLFHFRARQSQLGRSSFSPARRHFLPAAGATAAATCALHC